MKTGKILFFALVALFSDSSLMSSSNSMIRFVSAAFTLSTRHNGKIAQCIFSRTSSSSSTIMDGKISFLAPSRSRYGRHKMTESNEEDSNSNTTKESDSSAVAVEDKWDAYRNPSNRDDQVFSAISANGELKVTAATTRNVVNDLMMMHTLTAVPADALGRAVTCSLLLSNGMQAEQIFQLTLNCDGPIRGVVAIARGDGGVRGYVGNPMIGDMPLPEAIGKGTVQVVKNHPDWPNPYNGITAIEHRDVDRDVGIYLAESEQRSCALAAATSVNGILCTSAGGYIVEQLPGCTPETIQIVEQNLGNLAKKDGSNKLPTGLLLDGATPLDICSIVLEGLDMQPLGNMTPKLVCQCSEEKLFRAVRLLGKDEVDDIIAKEEQLEARCQFCGKVYRLGPEEVAKKFAEAQGDPSLDSDFEKYK